MDECSSLTALTSAWWRDLLELSAVCSWRVFESVNIARPLEPVRTGLWTVTQIPTGSKEQCGGKAVAVKALDLPLALLSVSKEEAEKVSFSPISLRVASYSLVTTRTSTLRQTDG